MTKRFTVNDLDNIQDNNPKGRLYILTERGGVNALCNLINGLNDKSNRLEKENEQLKSKNLILKGKLHQLRLKCGKQEEEIECLSEETIEKFKQDLQDGNFIEFTAR